MSVVPHRSDKTQPKPAAPSRRGVSSIADALAKVTTLRNDALKSRAAERIAKLADKTAQQTKHATESAVAASKVGLARAAEIGRESVLPELERTGAKLKERTRPERLKQDYKNYLFWLHARVLDPPTETLFFKPTKSPVALDGLTVRGPNREHGHDYRASPCALIKWTPSTTISRGSPSSTMARARDACCCSPRSIPSRPSAASSSPKSCMTTRP
jgi:hypothetical protein